MLQRLTLFMGRAFTFRPSDLALEDGQTTLEYTILGAVVVAMAVGLLGAFTGELTTAITKVGAFISTELATL
jgi:Flp pilus assembly pilin Flp